MGNNSYAACLRGLFARPSCAVHFFGQDLTPGIACAGGRNALMCTSTGDARLLFKNCWAALVPELAPIFNGP